MGSLGNGGQRVVIGIRVVIGSRVVIGRRVVIGTVCDDQQCKW